jgi:hypothetical protein
MTSRIKYYIKQYILQDQPKIKEENLYVNSYLENDKEFIQITIFKGYVPLNFLLDAKAIYGPEGQLWKEVVYPSHKVFEKISKWT